MEIKCLTEENVSKMYNFLWEEYQCAKDDYENSSFVAPKSMYHTRVSMMYLLFTDTKYYDELDTLINNVHKDKDGKFSEDSIIQMVNFLIRWGLLKDVENSRYSEDTLIVDNKSLKLIDMEDLKDIIKKDYEIMMRGKSGGRNNKGGIKNENNRYR